MASIEIFTGPSCTYCRQAKELLEAHGFSFVEYDIANPDHLREYLRRLPRTKSIPQIFVHGEHIGNEQDLDLLIRNGKLRELVDGR